MGCFGGVKSQLLCLQKIGATVFFLTFVIPPSILCDIHSAAKCVWQGLGQRAHFQCPLTLVCPDTCDECLQDTEGRQPAMSGFHYGLQRLGTASLIKQIILEGKATRKRRRKTGGGISLPLSPERERGGSKTSTHPAHCMCVLPSCGLSRCELLSSSGSPQATGSLRSISKSK